MGTNNKETHAIYMQEWRKSEKGKETERRRNEKQKALGYPRQKAWRERQKKTEETLIIHIDWKKKTVQIKAAE